MAQSMSLTLKFVKTHNKGNDVESLQDILLCIYHQKVSLHNENEWSGTVVIAQIPVEKPKNFNLYNYIS